MLNLRGSKLATPSDLVTKLGDREADVSVADVEEAVEQDWKADSEGAEELSEEAFKR